MIDTEFETFSVVTGDSFTIRGVWFRYNVREHSQKKREIEMHRNIHIHLERERKNE